MRFTSDVGSRCGPGKTSFAPTVIAMYGTPHAAAWNIGTTGNMTSVPEQPRLSGIAATIAWNTVERWLYTTPFGAPVVPDV